MRHILNTIRFLLMCGVLAGVAWHVKWVYGLPHPAPAGYQAFRAVSLRGILFHSYTQTGSLDVANRH